MKILLLNNFNKATREPTTTVKPPTQFSKVLKFDQVLSNSMETFAMELTNQVHNQQGNKNFMISPFLIYQLLVIISEGADGNTYNEIYDQLNLISIERTRDFQQYLMEALK